MAIPAPRSFRVAKNVPLAEEVFELTLEPADSEPLFAFQAGQWIMLHLLNEDGTTWKAPFSIASAPSESSTQFTLAIKVYGDFTKRARDLHVGNLVGVQGPYGVFTLRPGSGRTVFFAAGIGITPLLCMIREMKRQNDPREIVLFYTNRKREGIAYEEELQKLVADQKIRSIFSLTGETPEDWEGETRRIDAEMIERHLQNLDQADYYVCGPKPFMEMIRSTLAERGVDVKTKFYKEVF